MGGDIFAENKKCRRVKLPKIKIGEKKLPKGKLPKILPRGR